MPVFMWHDDDDLPDLELQNEDEGDDDPQTYATDETADAP